MYAAKKVHVFFVSLITHDRFGMFIHWGLYAQPARPERVKGWERMNDEQYQPYFELFNPDMFDLKTWAKQAKAEGMKYAVLTTKHHEGFCLFDSRYTDYKSTNTKAKRDLVQEYVNAFRAEGIKIGFYYSLIHRHHPDCTVEGLQIRELLTNYGKIDILWLDFLYPNANAQGKGRNNRGSVELLKMIRRLQPGIIVDNRLER